MGHLSKLASELAIDRRAPAKLLRQVSHGDPVLAIQKIPSKDRRGSRALRPFGAQTARRKRSGNAHSPSDVRPRVRLVAIADTRVNHTA